MTTISKLIFGSVEFPETEEFREFQYKFMIVLQLFAAATSLMFLWLVHVGASPRFSELHMQIMLWYSICSIGLWLIVRNRKHLFVPVAAVFELTSLVDLLSAFIFVDNDELRILWLFTNIPATYLILGRLVGAITTFFIITSVVLLNPSVALPLSPNALATCIIAMIYFAVFFHAYAKQSIYFFMRMRDSNARLKEMATRDVLTGALNARAYYEICDTLIAGAKRLSTPYAVLFIDLDHFKSINDNYGHAAGDLVLKYVTTCVAGSLRASDVMGRIGGEEFSAFLPNTDDQSAIELAEKLRKAIEGLMPSIGNETIRVTASIGVARNQHSEQTMLEIQKLADQAMYRAKSAGRNRVSAVETPDKLTQ